MASRIGPRSVKDATRFTSTIPHATSKTAGPTGGRAAASAAPKLSPRIPGETPEQRIRRLRQAHVAAQKAQISRTDRVIDASRRFLDVAHRWTVGGIVVFTAVAGVVSVYSVWDMLQYNRARRAEWLEAQRKLEADSLAAARIAYLKGDATEEQILLVEEANREAQEKGIKLPPLLSPPEHRTHFEEHVKPTFSRAEDIEKKKQEGKGVMGVVSGLFGGSKTVEVSAPTSQETALEGGVVQSIESKARDAWKTEKQNQINGGSLDQLGLETGSSVQSPAKRGWWPW
ncbi:hypothetical protein QQS21_004445 [Conoideocrella luteorostrata]|uniref:Cytochrome oxidase c assembly-domain-containing protein n=1 Tax=Conoideocrella luteorostrata TaxID=1105319 RepID=A0AAJ0CUE5_9HYPO|nr:hypothetical protein QQS21_004445 [Conoideocrella luteorostrata]